MKKNKIKIKKIFNIKLFLLIILISFLVMSSSYAMLSQRIIIGGTINGQKVYTYYFKKPADWNGSNMHAYIWTDGGSNTAAWPGQAMQYYTTSDGFEIYKVSVTSDINGYTTHNRIIFNDGSNQTLNISLNKDQNFNNILVCGGENGKQVLGVNRNSGWPGNKTYAYLWNSSTGIKNADWPGIEISNNELSLNLYATETEKNIYDKIIFNNGSYSHGDLSSKSDQRQTADLSIDFTTDKYYREGTGWIDLTQPAGHWSNYILCSNLTSNHINN